MTHYQEKLKHPKWQKKRLEIMHRAGWKCEDCGAEDRALSIHHCFYLPKRNPWEYDRDLLMCLCSTCHTDRAKYESAAHVSLARVLRTIKQQRIETVTWNMIEKAVHSRPKEEQ